MKKEFEALIRSLTTVRSWTIVEMETDRALQAQMAPFMSQKERRNLIDCIEIRDLDCIQLWALGILGEDPPEGLMDWIANRASVKSRPVWGMSIQDFLEMVMPGMKSRQKRIRDVCGN